MRLLYFETAEPSSIASIVLVEELGGLLDPDYFTREVVPY